jgi:hypothetical protein
MTSQTKYLLTGLLAAGWTLLPTAPALPGHVGSPPTPSNRHTAPAAAAHAGAFRFDDRDAHGQPVRWPSCQPIQLVVNPAGAGAGELEALRVAVHAVAAASGLTLQLTGTTSARPDSLGWPQALPAGGNGWPPVLIAWSAPGRAPLTDSSVSAVTTRVVATASDGRQVLAAGEIVVNRLQNRLYQGGVGGLAVPLFEHELGHLAGLDHVPDASEVMFPEIGHVRRLGPGDIRGLRLAGQGPCPPTAKS